MDQWYMEAFSAETDAYVDWLYGPGGLYSLKAGQSQGQSVLLELAPGKSAHDIMDAFAVAARQAGAANGSSPQLVIPEFYQHVDRSTLGAEQFISATVNSAFVSVLQTDESLRGIVNRLIPAQTLPDDAIGDPNRTGAMGPTGGPLNEATAERLIAGQQQGTDGPVVVGVIDEGIGFANQRFRRGISDSRVEYAWMQDGRSVGDVPGFGYGREFSKSDRLDRHGVAIKGIDTLLHECISDGTVDEDQFYTRVGLVDFARPGHKALAHRMAHGTHVMDLATGYEPGLSPICGGLDGRPIVCVQLPSAVVADTSGLGLERYMLDGIRYILDRADRIQRSRQCDPLPVVINFSSGILAGPHDGTHAIEQALDKIIKQRRKRAPTEVVLPSGNSHLSRLHAKLTLSPREGEDGGEAQILWRVLPDDRTCSYVEVWLPRECGGIELMIDPPGGTTSPPLSHAQGKRAIVWRPNGRDVLCKVYFEHFGPPTNRGRYLVALLPTEFDEPSTQLAPSGTWKIRLKNNTSQSIGGLEAWIQWDDRPLGYRRSGRQSYFIDPRYERFDNISGAALDEDNDSVVKRAGSINAIATGHETVVIGGFSRKRMTAAKYSAGGPIAQPTSAGAIHRVGPDALAVSDDSTAHPGILAAGTRSGSVFAMNGTSVAAPQITRDIADRLAKGERRPGREIVEELARRQEEHRPSPPMRPTGTRGGWGRIETTSIWPLQRFDEDPKIVVYSPASSLWRYGKNAVSSFKRIFRMRSHHS